MEKRLFDKTCQNMTWLLIYLYKLYLPSEKIYLSVAKLVTIQDPFFALFILLYSRVNLEAQYGFVILYSSHSIRSDVIFQRIFIGGAKELVREFWWHFGDKFGDNSVAHSWWHFWEHGANKSVYLSPTPEKCHKKCHQNR